MISKKIFFVQIQFFILYRNYLKVTTHLEYYTERSDSVSINDDYNIYDIKVRIQKLQP